MNHHASLSFLTTLLLLGTSLVNANAQSTWTDGAANGLWSNTGNLDPAGTPDGGENVVFATAGSLATLDGTSRTVGPILFNRGAAFELAATGGATLTIGGPVTISGISATYTISAPLAGTAPVSFQSISNSASVNAALTADNSGFSKF